jgi:hypothetical protein
MHTPLPNPDIASDKILKFDFFAVEPIDGDIHLGWTKFHEGPEIFSCPHRAACFSARVALPHSSVPYCRW